MPPPGLYKSLSAESRTIAPLVACAGEVFIALLMPTPNLDTAIRHEIDQFVSNLTTLVRQAALDAVKEALGATGSSVATPARRGPGRPRKNAAAPTATKPGRRTKRSSADVEAVANQVLAYVQANPGSRLEEIGRGMGV